MPARERRLIQQQLTRWWISVAWPFAATGDAGLGDLGPQGGQTVGLIVPVAALSR